MMVVLNKLRLGAGSIMERKPLRVGGKGVLASLGGWCTCLEVVAPHIKLGVSIN